MKVVDLHLVFRPTVKLVKARAVLAGCGARDSQCHPGGVWGDRGVPRLREGRLWSAGDCD